MGYNAPNYTEQNSTKTVIGGEIDIISGGKLKIAGTQMTASAAQLNTVAVDNVAVETKANAVSSTAGSTGFVAVAQDGITLLSCTGSTASALCGFRLPAPAAGVEKTLIASAGIDATHDAIVETSAASVTIGYAATNHRLALDALDEAVVLRGVSATKWIVVGNTGAVALSTNFTT